MKQFMLIFLVLCCLYISGQDFQISFQPSVSGTLIDSIWVTNQKTGQRVKLLASEALILTKSTSAFPDIRTYSKEGLLYPNPNTGSCAVYFSTNKMENVSICIFNASGQLLDHTSRKLKQGYHRFQVKFPFSGLFYLSLIKEDKTISYKAVCIDGQNQASRIWYEGSENSFTFNTPDVFKNASVIKTMTYSSDNILLFSAFSGKNNTIMTDSPTATKVYSVEFQKCEDQEKYNYPVVKIGEQWWMAKNLQSTKFNDGTPIEYIADNTPWMWAAHEAGAYCWFENSESSNKIAYGGLYNWYAVNRGKLCPAGWHVPNDEEWKQLELMLGMTKAQADATGWRGTDQGTRLKAPYGWKNDGNGSNISGFSGLSSGWRDWDGSFDGNGKYSGFWSVTPYSVTHAWSRTLGYQTGINRTWDYMEDGLSIRCCRDN